MAHDRRAVRMKHAWIVPFIKVSGPELLHGGENRFDPAASELGPPGVCGASRLFEPFVALPGRGGKISTAPPGYFSTRLSSRQEEFRIQTVVVVWESPELTIPKLHDLTERIRNTIQNVMVLVPPETRSMDVERRIRLRLQNRCSRLALSFCVNPFQAGYHPTERASIQDWIQIDEAPRNI